MSSSNSINFSSSSTILLYSNYNKLTIDKNKKEKNVSFSILTMFLYCVVILKIVITTESMKKYMQCLALAENRLCAVVDNMLSKKD
jgi:hypothetical protein